jgi:hydrogenase expression/formation protein HypC
MRRSAEKPYHDGGLGAVIRGLYAYAVGMCVAYPGQVLEVANDMALVETDRRKQRASLLLVPEVAVGDWVIVASGAVLRIVDPDEATEIRALLDQAQLQEDG